MTQIELVRKHLEDGKSITPAQAIAVYGIFRLASVIEDLRRKGMQIDCILRFDEMGKQYGTYRKRRPIAVGGRVQVKPGHGIGLPGWVRRLREAVVVPVEGFDAPDCSLVRFVRGKNVTQVWLNNEELVNVTGA